VLTQLALALFGLLALAFSMGRNNTLQRWAPLVGLCGQPAWIAFAIEAWGLLAISAAYTLVYIHGAWIHWGQAWSR